MSTGLRPTITLIENDDGWWTARDEERELTSQGETREAALGNLDEAVAAAEGDIGHQPSDAELRELGVDPENNTSSASQQTDLFE